MAAAAILEKFQMAISPQPVVRFTSCLILGWVFRGRRMQWLYFYFAKFKMAAAAILEKFQMAISPQPVVRFTSCLVLGWGFRGRRME